MLQKNRSDVQVVHASAPSARIPACRPTERSAMARATAFAEDADAELTGRASDTQGPSVNSARLASLLS